MLRHTPMTTRKCSLEIVTTFAPNAALKHGQIDARAVHAPRERHADPSMRSTETHAALAHATQIVSRSYFQDTTVSHATTIRLPPVSLRASSLRELPACLIRSTGSDHQRAASCEHATVRSVETACVAGGWHSEPAQEADVHP